LCGCWQVIAVERESLDLTKPAEPAARELGCYPNFLKILKKANKTAIM